MSFMPMMHKLSTQMSIVFSKEKCYYFGIDVVDDVDSCVLA